MKRHSFTAAFVLGLSGVIWVGFGFINSSVIALALTAVIGAAYVYGAVELSRFRRATSTLTEALAAIPENLTEINEWLSRLHPSLRNPVRALIEGERTSLPGPALTPYLVGLLVMLGMLGTFLGMVVTLKGAVFALEKTTDLVAMRSALAAPVQGLGLAFGTSIAGVAASAMLGLMSALSRQERISAVQLLHAKTATVLRRFSLRYQREETFKALQVQSQALPTVAEKMQAMMTQMEAMSQQLNQRLLGNQEDFHRNVKEVYTDLARSVDTSLRESLAQSGWLAGESIKPVVEAAMTGIRQEARTAHEGVAAAVQMQLDELATRLSSSASAAVQTWTAALGRHEQASVQLLAQADRSLAGFSQAFDQRAQDLVATIGQAYAATQNDQAERDKQRHAAWTRTLEETAASLTRDWKQTGAQTLTQQQAIFNALMQTAQELNQRTQESVGATLEAASRLVDQAEDLLRTRMDSEAAWLEQHRQRMHELGNLLRQDLGALREDEAARGQAAVERLGQLQSALAEHLTSLGTALEAPISRLIETAAEAPRAAAEVITQLRKELSNNTARDNELLQERIRIMETLDALLKAINHASQEQRATIDSLVGSSSAALGTAANAFSENVAGETAKLTEIAAQITGGAIEVSGLSAAFGHAVQAFNEANEKLIENLQRIEGAMDKSMLRSDEQLAYYVAQAREIIDLSMMSQKEIVEALRQLPEPGSVFAEEVR